MRLPIPFAAIALSAFGFRLFANDNNACRTLQEIVNTARDGEHVCTQGIVTDAFADDVDPRCSFLIVHDKAHFLPVALFNSPITNLHGFLDARVSVTGRYCERLDDDCDRKFVNPFLMLDEKDGLTILAAPPADPFDFPQLEDVSHVNPYRLSSLGKHKIFGTVLAVWGKNHVLLRDTADRVIKAEMSESKPLPKPGDGIAVVGYPSTDQFNLRFRHASWKKAQSIARPVPEPLAISSSEIMELFGKTAVNAQYAGKAVRMTGVIRSLPSETDKPGRALVECDGHLVHLDPGTNAEAFSDLIRDSVIRFSGIFIMDTRDWRPDNIFPRIEGLTIVIRDPSDIKVVSSPSWWTASRVACVALALLVALAAILVWNRSLNRLVTKRTRQLFGEELARERAELRVRERTCLAVELHDAISQNLTGVALEMDAVSRIAKNAPIDISSHVEHARQALRSCREELRNCLWDLRNDTLGSQSLDDAVRQTLAPHVGDIDLVIDFNVSRRKLSDNALHAILRTIRELASNAVRHGDANAIQVTGTIDGSKLHISVSDDGHGFDPQNCPGPLQGHFGLQGIRERIEGLDGTFEIVSKPGIGTTATISLALASILHENSQT